MELNFTEIENNNNNHNNSNFNNSIDYSIYWKTENQIENNKNYDTNNNYNNYNNYNDNNKTLKKKKVSFKDILNNMNLKINNQGTLAFMQTENMVEYSHDKQYQSNTQKKK